MIDVSRQNFFDSWLLLDEDNIYLDEVRLRFFDLPKKIISAVDKLDDYYSLLFLSQTIQMVLGGIKPACDYTIDFRLVELFQKNELMGEFNTTELSKILFDLFSVRITELEQIDDNNDSFLKFIIYNPSLLEKISDTHDELRPYRGENIKKWVQNNMYDGINENFLLGLIYGFPVSAIKQYIKYYKGSDEKSDNANIINNYGETYLSWGNEESRDAHIREELKERFFAELAGIDQYLNAISHINSKAQVFRDASFKLFEQSINFSNAQKI